MKRNFHKILGLSCIAASMLSACNKDQNVVLNGGTAPVLTASATDSIPLPITDSLSTAVSFFWTNPDYSFSTGTSSLGVNYYLEFDTVGANFTSPLMQQVAFTGSLNSSMTVSFLNNLIANKQMLAVGVTHQEQVMIVSFLPPLNSGVPLGSALNSNTLNFAVTPWAPPPAVNPPSSDTLYITGGATNLGWMVTGSVASVAGQGMTRVTPLLWTITLPLIGGQQFLLVPVAGDWGHKYATSDASSPTSGDTFGLDQANNFNGPTTSGTYTVTFNFQTGLYTITQN